MAQNTVRARVCLRIVVLPSAGVVVTSIARDAWLNVDWKFEPTTRRRCRAPPVLGAPGALLHHTPKASQPRRKFGDHGLHVRKRGFGGYGRQALAHARIASRRRPKKLETVGIEPTSAIAQRWRLRA